jgi:hypothetical protein
MRNSRISATQRYAAPRSATQRAASRLRASRRIASLRFAAQRLAALRTATQRPADLRRAPQRAASHRIVIREGNAMELFRRSPETDTMVRYLAASPKGTQITYADLGKAAGIAVTARTPKVTSARLILERDHAQVWAAVAPGVGLRRLNDVEIAELLPRWHLRGARNRVRRGSEQATIVEVQALDIDEQARFACASIQASLAADALSRATFGRLAKVARGNANDLPAFNAVEWAISLTKRKS